VPKQYVAGTAAPFMVGTDGIDRGWFTVLDNLIAQKRVPVMIAISVGSGGGDGPGSERGLEYDTMSGKYAEWVQVEVLPLAEKTAGVKLTDDPDGRGTIGSSSGGAAAMAMAWFHPEWYHRVLTRSGTFVNQQWPHNDAAPHGAFDVSAWSQIELLVDATKGTARMAVAQPPGSKAVEVLDFRETTAGKVGPIALQMHNAGLFDEYRDISIEVDPKEDRLITTE
jgi:enterochelin esterase-like enzyme